MILQNQGHDHPFVVSQLAHMNLAKQLAEAFGNDQFVSLAPNDEMLFVIANHDYGWNQVDEDLTFKSETGLPYNLVETPVSELMRTGPGSTEYCEGHHPYCGLMVSMHTYGLYTGRYGMSDKVYVDMISAEDRPLVDAMLARELSRQARLKKQLLLDKVWARWVSDEMLFYNYKRLQFFDTLALYFNLDADPLRRASTFKNVSMNLHQDVDIEVTPVASGVYQVHPFPFSASIVNVSLDRLKVKPEVGASLAKVRSELSLSVEDVQLVPRS